MLDFENKLRYDMDDLIKLMEFLRSPDGCPWDAEQTHDSIRRNLLEEAYEAAEAIDLGKDDNFVEELGDMLLQVVFHADIAKKNDRFDFDKIVDTTCKKLIRRHPHVFGDNKAKDGKESLDFWEEVKREEKKSESVTDDMESVARSLPALWRAEKIQKKSAKVGFDLPDYNGALDALKIKLDELEVAANDGRKVDTELGDLLFFAVNFARFFEIDPEMALNASNDRYITRFSEIESTVAQGGNKIEDVTLDYMEEINAQLFELEE